MAGLPVRLQEHLVASQEQAAAAAAAAAAAPAPTPPPARFRRRRRLELSARPAWPAQSARLLLNLHAVRGHDCVSRRHNRRPQEKFNWPRLAGLLAAAPADAALELCLHDMELNDRHAGGLAKLLLDAPAADRVRRLDLADNRFLVPGCRKLARGIVRHRGLRALSMRGNRSLGPVGCAAVADAVCDSPAVESLDLGDTALCQFHFDLGVKQVSRLCAGSTTLLHLDLSDNEMRTLQVELLCAGIADRQAPCLRDLNLSGNAFGDHGTEVLSRTLVVDNPRFDGADENAAAAAASAAVYSPWHLDLSGCGVGVRGARALATAIEAGAVAGLVLDHNAALGELGARALAEALVPCRGKICAAPPAGDGGAKAARRRAAVAHALLPKTGQCTCTCCGRLDRLSLRACRGISGDVGEVFLRGSLATADGWVNGMLRELVFDDDGGGGGGGGVRSTVVGYVPLRDNLLLAALGALRFGAKLPQEMGLLVCSYLCQPVRRSVWSRT